MKNLSKILLVTLGLAYAGAQAQTDDGNDQHNLTISIPEVALVDLEAASGTAITLDAVAPTEAGSAITYPADSTIWLNYSSIKNGSGEATRVIQAKLSAVIAGVDIKVTPSAASATGDGAKGTSAGTVTLTTTDQDVITSIGSAYTGDGVDNGHRLKYSLATNSYSALDAASGTQLQITYTISDE